MVRKERSQSLCTETPVCFDESLCYLVHVKSAYWRSFFKKKYLYHSSPRSRSSSLSLFPDLSPPLITPLPSLQAPLLCSCSFTHPLTAHPIDLLLYSCVFCMLPLSSLLCSQHTLPKGRGERRRLPLNHWLMCVFREERFEGEWRGCQVN